MCARTHRWTMPLVVMATTALAACAGDPAPRSTQAADPERASMRSETRDAAAEAQPPSDAGATTSARLPGHSPSGADSAPLGALDVSGHDTVDFVTASGLTRCRMTAQEATCALPTGYAETALPGEVSECWSQENPDATPAGVSVGRFAQWRCPDDVSVEPTIGTASTRWFAEARWDPVQVDGVAMAQLPFGATLLHSGVSCTAETDAMRCRGTDDSMLSMNTAGVSFTIEGEPTGLTSESFGAARFGTTPAEIVDPLTELLGAPEDSGFREGCPLAGEGYQMWEARWGAFYVYGQGFEPGEIEVISWSLDQGTTSVPVVLPGGLSTDSSPEDVLASDPTATQTSRFFGEPGSEVVSHDLTYVFDEYSRLLHVLSNPQYCD